MLHLVVQREGWIDIMKGLGILSIVLSHAYIPDTFTKKFIYSFSIPLFFFVSGYLHVVDKQMKIFKKRFHTLIIPYTFFYFISTAWYIFYTNVSSNVDPYSLQIRRVLGFFYGVGSDQWMYNITLWFLVCLFVVTLSYNYIALHFKKSTSLFLLLLFSIISYQGSLLLTVRIPWGTDVAFSGIVFFGLGALFKRKNYLERLFNSKYSVLSIAVFLPASIITAYYNSEIDMNTLKFGNYFLFYTSAITGIMWIAILSKKIIRKSSILTYFSKNSLTILGTHTVVLVLLPSIMKRIKFLDIKNYSDSVLINGMWLFLLTILIEFPIIYILNKYFNLFIGNRSIIYKSQINAL